MSTPRTDGKHDVAGQWLKPSGETFPSRSPANRNEVIGTFPSGTERSSPFCFATLRASGEAKTRAA